MALSKNEQGQLRDYLLGKLSDDEQQKIEERLMVEDQFFDEFEVSKDQLVEEYRAGELAQQERQWLEENFLATSDGREREAFTLAMECLQQRPDPSIEPPPVVTPDPQPWVPPDPQPWVPADPQPWVPAEPQPRVPSGQQFAFLGPIQAFARTQPWAFAAASLVLVLLVAFATVRITRPKAQVFSVTLPNSSVVRSGGPPTPKLTLPPNTGQLKLRLQLPKTTAPNSRFAAQLDDRINTKPVEIVETDPEAVTVIVPAELLTRGEYQVHLNTTKPDGTEQELTYQFNVE